MKMYLSLFFKVFLSGKMQRLLSKQAVACKKKIRNTVWVSVENWKEYDYSLNTHGQYV